MQFLFIGLVLLVSFSESKTAFDGQWELDRSIGVGTIDDILALAGANFEKRWAAKHLDVLESYEFSQDLTKVRFIRETKPIVTKFDHLFTFGLPMHIDDAVYGSITETFNYLPARQRIDIRVEEENHSVLKGAKIIFPNAPKIIQFTMNYTSFDGRKASCVTFYRRK